MASQTTAALVHDLIDGLAGRIAARERTAAPPPTWLRRLRARLDAALDGDGALDLDSLAADAGVHPRHVMRAFRRFVGCSLGGYVRRARIARARELLAATDMPIAAIAVDLGFYDQSHFTRVFRRETGMPPNELRRLARRTRSPRA